MAMNEPYRIGMSRFDENRKRFSSHFVAADGGDLRSSRCFTAEANCEGVFRVKGIAAEPRF
jgi:hypothetical protein